VDQTTKAFLTRARQEWPQFSELEPTIKALMSQHEGLSIHDAYIAAFRQEGLKKLEDGYREKYAGTLQRKVDASSVPPNPPTGRVVKSYVGRDPREVAEELAANWGR
jgi:transposase